MVPIQYLNLSKEIIDRGSALSHLLDGQAVTVHGTRGPDCGLCVLAVAGGFEVAISYPSPIYAEHRQALQAAENLSEGFLTVTQMQRGLWDMKQPNRKARRDKQFGRKPNQPR